MPALLPDSDTWAHDAYGHTCITVPAPFGELRIAIYRGGLEGGDNFIAVSGVFRWKAPGKRNEKWLIRMARIETDNYRTWPEVYYCHGINVNDPPSPPDDVVQGIAAQMRGVYQATITKEAVDAARLHALRTYLGPVTDSEIRRARETLHHLVNRRARWQAELTAMEA
jgi:hypothetical protein